MALFATNSGAPHEPKGDLEHLFRQKFAEVEVPPRRDLWEQIDHELLVRQNESYRHRLSRQRWVAAACVALVLAAATWATTLTLWPAAGPGNTAFRTQLAEPLAPVVVEGVVPGTVAAEPELLAATSLPAAAPPLAVMRGTSPARLATEAPGTEITLGTRAGLAFFGLPRRNGTATDGASQAPLTQAGLGSQAAAGAAAWEPGASFVANRAPLRLQPASRLAGLPDTLRKLALPAGPTLAAQPASSPSPPTGKANRPWRWSASVAAAAFNPNINFSRAGSSEQVADYYAANNISGARSVELYEQVAAEYRHALVQRAGVRARAGATRQLGQHWELTTGVAVASQTAGSQFTYNATQNRPLATAAFAGGTRVEAAMGLGLDAGANATNISDTRPTRYRYTTAGVPVAVRYGSSKTGWSLYATVGAAVDVLLSSRVEVAGVAEATRTYSVGTPDSPYRKVLASVRGGGGARYRSPDGKWSLLVGPEAEAGLSTLNADPAQSFFKRSRPYAVGLATTVEFGGGKPATMVQ